MADLVMLDQAYHHVMQRIVHTGQAPHYTELATELGLAMEAGKQLLHELIDSGIPAWLHPQTDYLVSFAPFHNLPTQYRITVDGEQKWFAQGGFEALAVRWLFPGKTVRVDAPCLDCGASLAIEMRDEEVLRVEPRDLVGYAYSEVGGPPENRAWRGAGMNLFRSEEHSRHWASFNPAFEVNLQPLSYWLERFSGERFRARIRPDYISWLQAHPR